MTQETDPRLIISRALDKISRGNLLHSEEIDLILAAIDALPRPELGEGVVTEGMVAKAIDCWRSECENQFAEGRRSVKLDRLLSHVLTVAFADALDPRRRTVEPVAGDAVEAANTLQEGGVIAKNTSRYTPTQSDAAAVKGLLDSLMDIAKALPDTWKLKQDTMNVRTQLAANLFAIFYDVLPDGENGKHWPDRARGRAFVTWRRPEEFIIQPMDDERVYVMVLNADGSRNQWPAWCQLSGGVVAWHDQPAPPPWATPARTAEPTLGVQTRPPASDIPQQHPGTRSFWDTVAARRAADPSFAAALDEEMQAEAVARTATDDGGPREPAHSDTTHETPSAAVLAGGDDIDGLPERLRISLEEMANVCSGPMPAWNTHANTCLEAADEIVNLRNSLYRLACETSAAPAQPPLADAPEAPAVVWTAQLLELIEELADEVIGLALGRGSDGTATRLKRMRAAAFPSGTPAWPEGCLARTPESTCRAACRHKLVHSDTTCPHAGRGETGNG